VKSIIVANLVSNIEWVQFFNVKYSGRPSIGNCLMVQVTSPFDAASIHMSLKDSASRGE
jgi:hypothetical protein